VLSAAILEYNLSPIHFKRVFDRRERDIREEPLRRIEDLENFGEETASSLLYLALQLNGVNNTAADHAASHIGKALGISTLLRSTAFHSGNRKSYLPLNIMSKHGLSEESLFRGEAVDPSSTAGKALHEVMYEVSSSAKIHMDKAHAMLEQVPKEARTVLLPGAIAEDFLNTLQKKNFNAYDPAVSKRNPLLTYKIGWNWYRNKY